MRLSLPNIDELAKQFMEDWETLTDPDNTRMRVTTKVYDALIEYMHLIEDSCIKECKEVIAMAFADMIKSLRIDLGSTNFAEAKAQELKISLYSEATKLCPDSWLPDELPDQIPLSDLIDEEIVKETSHLDGEDLKKWRRKLANGLVRSLKKEIARIERKYGL